MVYFELHQVGVWFFCGQHCDIRGDTGVSSDVDGHEGGLKVCRNLVVAGAVAVPQEVQGVGLVT